MTSKRQFFVGDPVFAVLLCWARILSTVLCTIIADDIVQMNTYFEGYKFWSSKVSGLGTCAVVCVRMTKCDSFNFDLSTSVCEMNNDTLENHGNDGVEKVNSLYSRITDWPVEIDPECYDRPCKLDEVCIPRAIANYISSSSRCLKALRNPPSCQPGWMYFGGSCYFFSSDQTFWDQARSECNNKDASLVKIETEEEQNFLTEKLLALHPVANTISYWTSGNDFGEDGHWVWSYPTSENEKESITYTKWSPGEPNRADEDCLMLHRPFGFKWANYPCGHFVYYICEKPIINALAQVKE